MADPVPPIPVFPPTTTPDNQFAIEPIEDFIAKGLQSRFQQVFECPVIYTTSTDKTKALQRFLEGKQVKYPYAFLMPGAISPNPDTYNPHVFGRRGLVSIVKDGFSYAVRLMPANMEYDIEYVTNAYSTGSQKNSVLAFIRRWLFARRFGYLKFTINYGRLALGIGCVLSDTPVIPIRDSVTENESSYTITANITVKGYLSEPQVSQVGIINEVLVDSQLMNADGSLSGGSFFPFDLVVSVTSASNDGSENTTA